MSSEQSFFTKLFLRLKLSFAFLFGGLQGLAMAIGKDIRKRLPTREERLIMCSLFSTGFTIYMVKEALGISLEEARRIVLPSQQDYEEKPDTMVI